LDQTLQPFVGQRVSLPITYLGLPLTLGRLRLVHVQSIIDKTRAKLAGWQGRLLDIAGRRELVCSVLSSIPIYLLSALKVPKQLTKDIGKARRRFLWASDNEITGDKCKVAWTLVAKPIEFRGLGILDLGRFNRALRLRWLWYSWEQPQRAWSGKTMPIDEVDAALFAAATTVTVRNGRKALFWHSRWADGRPLLAHFPLLYGHSRRKNRTVEVLSTMAHGSKILPTT
jgi:hypothetical protein